MKIAGTATTKAATEEEDENVGDFLGSDPDSENGGPEQTQTNTSLECEAGYAALGNPARKSRYLWSCQATTLVTGPATSFVTMPGWQ